MRLLFPLPLRPTTATLSPGQIDRFTSRSATTTPLSNSRQTASRRMRGSGSDMDLSLAVIADGQPPSAADRLVPERVDGGADVASRVDESGGHILTQGKDRALSVKKQGHGAIAMLGNPPNRR